MPKPVSELIREVLERVTEPADQVTIDVLSFLLTHPEHGFSPSDIAAETGLDIHEIVTAAVYLKDERVIKRTRGYYYVKASVRNHGPEFMNEHYGDRMDAMDKPVAAIETAD